MASLDITLVRIDNRQVRGRVRILVDTDILAADCAVDKDVEPRVGQTSDARRADFDSDLAVLKPLGQSELPVFDDLAQAEEAVKLCLVFARVRARDRGNERDPNAREVEGSADGVEEIVWRGKGGEVSEELGLEARRHVRERLLALGYVVDVPVVVAQLRIDRHQIGRSDDQPEKGRIDEYEDLGVRGTAAVRVESVVVDSDVLLADAAKGGLDLLELRFVELGFHGDAGVVGGDAAVRVVGDVSSDVDL